MRDPIESFMELVQLVQGTPLGDILLETVAAAQEHHTMTARLGVNTDGSVSVFSKDGEKAKLMAQAILAQKGRPPVPVSVPPLELSQVRELVRQPGVLEAFTGDPKPQRMDGWKPAVARLYLRNVVGIARDAYKLRALKKYMDDDDGCCESEGRFRAVLLNTLKWSVADMDEAVVQVRSGQMSPCFGSASTVIAMVSQAESVS